MFLSKNLQYLTADLKNLITNSPSIGILDKSKTGQFTISFDSIYLHSKHDPVKEAQRFVSELKDTEEERLYIFFGAGLGYSVKEILNNKKDCKAIWMECYPEILKHALTIFDFSNELKNERLKILIKPFREEDLFTAFKGVSSLPTSFIPHRQSVVWKEQEYIELKYICEKFFRKKDVNIATLSRFEKIWARNIIQNIPDLFSMIPISTIFGIAKDVPILVCGAGPSLDYDIENIKKYRDCFIIIAVDTALHVLENHHIDPDLIFSVDPQSLNSSYLQGYHGNGKLVFDPTSTYHTLRISDHFKKGFFTSSPFPLIKILTEHVSIDLGEIQFGGSVSTNAVSLAELMGASNIYFVGQDLAFTDGFAHCRGAILEERLNYKESRFFRREKHNHLQLTALSKKYVKGYDGKSYITNEKMMIFNKWFSDHSIEKNWINLTINGAKIDGIPKSSFEESFQNFYHHEKVKKAKEQIQNKLNDGYLENGFSKYINIQSIKESIQKTILEMEQFTLPLKQGKHMSESIYKLIEQNKSESKELHELIKKINLIDESVSSKKGLNQIVGMSVQRIILMITEGYDSNLSVQEKLNEKLAIAKKSILLYSGLLEASIMTKKLLKKVFYRISSY